MASYADAVGLLGGALTFGIRPSLDGIRVLTEALGRPQDAFACVQTTGTNGKTSATRAAAALLAAEGLTTGAYTSPHLVSYTERIEVGGRPVAEPAFAEAVEAAAEAAADAGGAFTEFELLTAAALWLFRERGVEIACLEVGMGGRWDATSIVAPAVAAVTGVGLDHMERLGRTRAEIAADKAHVIKPASTPVLGPGLAGVEEAFLARAHSFGLHPRAVAAEGDPSPVAEHLTVRFRVASRPHAPRDPLALDVDGVHARYAGLVLHAPAYQAPNVAVAVGVAEAALGRALDSGAARAALGALTFPGRFEVVREVPLLVLDGAHNPAAARVLAGAIDDSFPSPPMVVLGVLRDKDAEGIVTALAGRVFGFVATQPSSPRAMPAAELAGVIERLTARPCAARAGLAEALALAEDVTSGGVMVTGSLYLAGEAARLRRS